jgi:protocatechuate 4,5-dioxygenase, beta chain
MASVVAVLAVPHDPTLPAGVARGADAPGPIQEAGAIIERQRELLAAARPDAIVIVAGDHLNQWFLHNMPAFLVGKATRSRGPFPDEQKLFGIEALDVPNDGALARRLLTGGFERGVDFAYSDEYTLDHAFTVPLLLVRPERDLPVVPVFTNILAPPLPPARRFHEVGVAIRDTIDGWEQERRVAVIVTGHMTNNIGGPRMMEFVERPQSDWDRRTWRLIEDWDLETLIAESTFENLNRAGHATPAFLDFILGFGVAGGPPGMSKLIATPVAPALTFFAWTEQHL